AVAADEAASVSRGLREVRRGGGISPGRLTKAVHRSQRHNALPVPWFPRQMQPVIATSEHDEVQQPGVERPASPAAPGKQGRARRHHEAGKEAKTDRYCLEVPQAEDAECRDDEGAEAKRAEPIDQLVLQVDVLRNASMHAAHARAN